MKDVDEFRGTNTSNKCRRVARVTCVPAAVTNSDPRKAIKIGSKVAGSESTTVAYQVQRTKTEKTTSTGTPCQRRIVEMPQMPIANRRIWIVDQQRVHMCIVL